MFWRQVLLLFVTSSLHALVEKKIDEKMAFEVMFSKTSHNRISVEGGSIQKVFGDGSMFSVTLDSITGSAFINVVQDIQEFPVTLTVVTNSGLVQDFSVLSRKGPSEQVILKEDEDVEADEMETNTEIYHATSVDLLNKILEGKTPVGYGKKEVLEEYHIDLPKPLASQTLKVFEGVFEMIAVYGIKNEGKQPIVVTAESFRNDNNSWVFLNAQELEKNQQAICIISYPKE